VQVLTMTGAGIARIDGFQAGGLHAPFGLPAALPD